MYELEYEPLSQISPQSTKYTNHQLTHILYDDISNYVIIGSEEGCLFVYRQLNPALHQKLVATELLCCGMIQQTILYVENGQRMLLVLTLKLEGERQIYQLHRAGLDDILRLQDRQQYNNEKFILQPLQTEAKAFPELFERPDYYIYKMIQPDAQKSIFAVHTHSQLLHLRIEGGRHRFSNLLEEFSNLVLQAEQYQQVQDVFMTSEHLLLQLLGSLIFLRYDNTAQRYLVTAVHSVDSGAETFDSQQTIWCGRGSSGGLEVLYQASPAAAYRLIVRHGPATSDKVGLAEARARFSGTGVLLAALLVPLHDVGSRVVGVAQGRIVSETAVCTVADTATSCRYQRLRHGYRASYFDRDYAIVYKDVTWHPPRGVRRAYEDREYIVVHFGRFRYQSYDSYFCGFRTVGQNVLFFEREDEYDVEPDNVLYAGASHQRSVDVIRQQVRDLRGYTDWYQYQIGQDELL